MNNFYLITNREKDGGLEVTSKIADYLKKHQKGCLVQEIGKRREEGRFHYTDPALIPKDTDAILVLGGDGTLIQAARDTVSLEIPLLGINLGHLGYLCELDGKNLFPALDKLLDDHYYIEERMMISGSVRRGDKEIKKDLSLNDIVLYRMGSLGIKDFTIYVNQKFLKTYHSDGIIFSTPTGSTGYSLSAGGPIVDPVSEMLLVTPINPHSLSRRSIILSPDDEIVAVAGEGHSARESGVGISFDGGDSLTIFPGDEITIKKSEKRTKILRTSKISFLETLCKRMQE